jgi:protein YibB
MNGSVNVGSITIITCFYNIKREEFKKFKRTEQDYINFFDKIARLKNPMVIYCEENNVEIIKSIREKHGNRENTIIEVLTDLRSLDPCLYENIKKTMNNKYSKKFMFFSDNPEVISNDYNFLMLIKALLVKNAILKYKINGLCSWIDFGFDGNNIYYPNKEEFSFEWEYNFEEDVIHLFQIKDNARNLPVFEIVRRMETFIQGGMIIAHSNLWGIFWEELKKCYDILINVGLIDDDQIFYYMVSKINPNLFLVHPSYWNEALKLYGGNHLTYVKPSLYKKSLKSRIIRCLHKTAATYRYSCIVFRMLMDEKDYE